jgi:tRNA pseudouridine38-40 synthase
VVGTIVEMGTGQRRAGEMASIVRARQRSSAARVAPPHGLYLWEIIYPLGTVDDVGEHAYSLS